jgi:hypothetical protein
MQLVPVRTPSKGRLSLPLYWRRRCTRETRLSAGQRLRAIKLKFRGDVSTVRAFTQGVDDGKGEQGRTYSERSAVSGDESAGPCWPDGNGQQGYADESSDADQSKVTVSARRINRIKDIDRNDQQALGFGRGLSFFCEPERLCASHTSAGECAPICERSTGPAGGS